MPASPPTARHGAWRLVNAGNTDAQIRMRLDRDETVEQIADALGIATGYVEAFIRDEREANVPAPPREPPRLAPSAEPIESPVAAARVHCIVAGEEIGARECISRQCSDKCFCPKASFAINAIAPTVLPGTRLEDQLAQCKAVARSVLTKASAEERHLGPALVALRGGKVEPRPLIAGDPPAPPKREDQEPLITARPEPKRAPALPQEDDVSEQEVEQLRHDTAKAVLATREGVKPKKNWDAWLAEKNQRREAAEKKEKPMKNKLHAVSDEEFRRVYEEESGSLKAIGAKYGAAASTVRARIVKLGLKVRVGGHIPKAANGHTTAKAERKPRGNGHDKPQAKPPPTVAARSDITELLEQELAHHQAQAQRITKALAALRE